MFSKACSIARNFTFPIVISSLAANGECNAGIGTFIIINDEGWFITANHIIAQIQQLMQSNKEYEERLKKRESIEADLTLKKHQKNQQLNTLRIDPKSIKKFSVLVANSSLSIGTVHTLPEVDLAVGQLLNYNKSLVKVYPKFKDAKLPMEQGTSLCKLGFPFHSIKPTFDPATGFLLPAGSLPIPIFPIEGIYTRTVYVKASTPKPYPLMYIETSTPGLRGQSGGPTFDVNGSIWAIQSQTQHFKLGFGDNQKNSKETEHLKNQYLNVGWGTHASTVTNFLVEKKIAYQLDSL